MFLTALCLFLGLLLCAYPYQARVRSNKTRGTDRHYQAPPTTSTLKYIGETAGGGGGATVTFTVDFNGGLAAITAAPVAPGSGYPPSTTIALFVTGGGGSFGVISATTNGSGAITAFGTTPLAAGSGYTATAGAATSNFIGMGFNYIAPGYGWFVTTTDEVIISQPLPIVQADADGVITGFPIEGAIYRQIGPKVVFTSFSTPPQAGNTYMLLPSAGGLRTLLGGPVASSTVSL